MSTFFDTLQVGDTILTRETQGSPWELAKVVMKEGNDITFENEFGEISTNREEVNELDYFRPRNIAS